MISRWQALNLAFRHRATLSKMVEFRHDPSIAWHGSLTEPELECLQSAVRQSSFNAGPIIEIGTLFGFTTAMMASGMKDERKLITVDNYSWNPWGLASEVHKSLARRILSPFTLSGRVEIVDRESDAFLATYAGPAPSLLFIDGDHSYAAVHRDIAGAKRIGSAMIGGHDYSAAMPGVVQAVEEHFHGEIVKIGTVWMWGPK